MGDRSGTASSRGDGVTKQGRKNVLTGKMSAREIKNREG